MNKYEETYKRIQKDSSIENELIAKEIVQNLEKEYSNVLSLTELWKDKSYMEKLFLLLSSPSKFLVIAELNKKDLTGNKKYQYSLNAELQLIIANICYSNEYRTVKNFEDLQSLINAQVFIDHFLLNTHVGVIKVFKTSHIFPNLKDYTRYGECHYQCHRLILNESGVSASTALIDRPLGGKHYHSFINYDDYVIDLSHNALMTKEDYSKAFKPEILNTIYGEELYFEEERINNKESLGKDKELLLRLALDKQVK